MPNYTELYNEFTTIKYNTCEFIDSTDCCGPIFIYKETVQRIVFTASQDFHFR